MILKKLFTLPFSRIKKYEMVYTDEKDLLTGLISVCDILKNKVFIIQVFSRDKTMNTLLEKKCQGSATNKNWNYYYVDDISILKDINLANQRFLCIYSLEKFYQNFEELKDQIKTSALEIILENYLELTKLRIDTSQYSKEVMDVFLERQSF